MHRPVLRSGLCTKTSDLGVVPPPSQNLWYTMQVLFPHFSIHLSLGLSTVEQMNSFHLRCLRNLLRIKWFNRIPDTKVLERANSESIYALITRACKRWSGHVARMSDGRLPKRIIYWELCSGRRSQGGQKKRLYKDILGELWHFS